MKVIIPAAGEGKRLRPHTITKPKPILPIAGSTIIDFIMTEISSIQDLEEVIFIVGYLQEQMIEYLKDKYQNIKDITQIEEKHIHHYIASLKRAEFSKQTISRKIIAIKEFHKFLYAEKICDTDPAKFIDLPKPSKPLPVVLSKEEITRMIDSIKTDTPLDLRNKAMIETLYASGLRISELVGLKTSDIHLREKYIVVIGKGNKERILYLNEACIQAIQDYLAVRDNQRAIDKNALFLSRRRTRISKAAVEKLVKKYLLKAGLDSTQYSPHKLRHTAATLMLQNGVDVRTLQEVLGHENLNTTQIYTHVDNENLRAAAKANPLGHGKPKKKQGSESEDLQG